MSVRNGEFARDDRSGARQQAEPRHVADDREDADEHDELDASPTRVCGSTFHISQRTGCAIATAHTDP